MSYDYDLVLIQPSYGEVYGFKEDISSKLPPFGLMCLSSYLKTKGFKVKIIDLEVEDENELENVLEKSSAQIFGITSVTSVFPEALRLARKIKLFNKENIVLLGGPHATALPKDILEVCSDVDIIVYGEGEETLARVLENRFTKLNEIKGITYRKYKKIIVNEPAAYLSLNALPMPDHNGINYKRYVPSLHRNLGYPFGVTMISRGCPFACKYCGTQTIFGKKIRFRPIENVVKEIEYLIKNYKVRNIVFWDDTFTLNRKYTLELSKILKNYNLAWSCNTRPDRVDKDLLKEMKEAGCKIIFYGVESSNEEILKRLGRNMTIKQIIEAIKITKEIGVRCTASMMIGTPFDTKEQIERNIEFMIELDPDLAFFSPFAPHPGTPIYNLCVQQNIIPSWKEWLKSHFEGIPLNHPTANRYLTRKEIQDYVEKAYNKFYSRKEFFTEREKRWNEDWEMKILENLRNKFGGENNE